MKALIKNFVRRFGLDVVRYSPNQNAKKSIRTNELVFHQTATGNYFLPKDAHQDSIANAIKQNEVFDDEIYQIAKEFIKPNTTALDVGSNFGQMAVLMSKLVGKNGNVHAFEADDFVFEILQKNIKQNSANIIPHFAAVHDKADEILYFPTQDFERFGTYGSYGIDYVHGKGRPINTLRIDDIEFELPVSFMKIDIQGGDLFALRGAVETIKKHQMPIIFEYEYLFEQELKLNFQEYVDFVRSINYRFERVIMGQNYLIVSNNQ
jgi:FkbM family methyltransferase